MMFLSALLTTLLFAGSCSAAASNRRITDKAFHAYATTIIPVPGSNSSISGTVIVMTEDGGPLFYGGFASGLQPNLNAKMDCNFTNGCGVHIHAGYGCETTDVQLGHLYNEDTILVDPWLEERYSSDSDGNIKFGGVLDMGTVDVEGRAFIVHAQDGTRVGCGILVPAEDHPEDLLVFTSHSMPLRAEMNTHADVIMVTNIQEGRELRDRLCYFGYASGLPPNLESFLVNHDSEHCNAAFGCGTHVHRGKDCTNTTTQEGHWYDGEALVRGGGDGGDPWLISGYPVTSDEGTAYFGDCLETGHDGSEIDNRLFIIHDEDGSRIACGNLARLGAPAPVAPPPTPPAPTSEGIQLRAFFSPIIFSSSFLALSVVL